MRRPPAVVSVSATVELEPTGKRMRLSGENCEMYAFCRSASYTNGAAIRSTFSGIALYA